jgi:hypothetical protein
VFIATPTNIVKDYAWEAFYAGIKALTYKKKVFWVSDNTKGNDYAHKLRKLGVNVAKVKPKNKTNIEYMCESHNMLREMFLKSEAQFMLHLESDVIPPPDVIERLLIHKKNVVAAPYFIDFGTDSHLMLIDKEDKSNNVQHTMRIDKGFDFKIMDGKLHKVMNGGLGCTLIHRSVMENISFRHEKDFFVDTSILCKHLNSEWTHF